ncbi:MAG: hypothetical protein BMS9Abin13_440 [Patescibacteria group bacterium]|nr:MAG: hypothetical protein BMS9Abin13_440 [Patescibacteria group bacterium]
MLKKLLVFFVLILSVAAPAIADVDVVCTTDNIDNKTEQQLALISEKCEEERKQQEVLLKEKQRETVTIERDLQILNYNISKSRADIRSREIKIYNIKKEIVAKSDRISELSNKEERMQTSLSELMRKTNELDSYSLVEAMLSNESLSDFFIDIDDLGVLKKEMRVTLLEMSDIRDTTKEAKVTLEEKENREWGLKLTKEKEKRKSESYKSEKRELLALNREEEGEYKKEIARKEQIKREIRNRIFRTVGGVEISFGDALKLIQPYEEVVGVESALVLAVLFQESGANGVIGGNLGRCTYNQPWKNKSGTVMRDSQKKSFLVIMQELGRNQATTPVSCPIPRDGLYGGAMGPAQFMPNTWWDVRVPGDETGYKKRVAKVLKGVLDGRSPSPFVNLDAFIGTSLYLSDALRRCKTAFSGSFDLWSCSAAKYYSGLMRTTDRGLLNYMRPRGSYGYKVAARAQQFQKDIDILDL